MQDERARALEAEQKRAWVEPALSRLQAGSAELAGGPTDDGVDKS
jgi:hypothetical protein